MLRPAIYSRQRDWFVVDPTTAQPLFQEINGQRLLIPGVKLDPKNPTNFLIHRSLLPLLDSPDATRALITKATAWETRNARCELLGIKPRTTQHEALDFIEPRRGVLLADDMRLGKTLTGVLAHDPARGPLVIVGPLSTRAVWLGWIRKVFPDEPISVLAGKKFDPTKLKAKIIWIHYDIIHKWQAAFPIGTLVLDEGHALVNRKSKRSLAAAILASRAEKIIVATGTPIWNKPAPLWNVIGMIAPGAWGSYYDFGYRYGLPNETGYGVEFTGISNEDELRARLSEVMIRRRWSEVVADLPQISRNIIVAEIDDVTRKKLDLLAGKLRTERTNTAANLAIYRSKLGPLKLRTVVEEATRARERGEPIVIWTWHRAFAHDVAEKLETPYLIDGEVPADKRERIMDAWRTQPNAPLVATMAVAQVGIDLSHSHLALFAELDWTPAIIAQTEMRTFAPTRPMNVSFVVANHFVDQRIVRALIEKLGASNPLGLGSAIESIDALRDAIEGPRVEPDMDRFLDDILANEIDAA